MYIATVKNSTTGLLTLDVESEIACSTSAKWLVVTSNFFSSGRDFGRRVNGCRSFGLAFLGCLNGSQARGLRVYLKKQSRLTQSRQCAFRTHKRNSTQRRPTTNDPKTPANPSPTTPYTMVSFTPFATRRSYFRGSQIRFPLEVLPND